MKKLFSISLIIILSIGYFAACKKDSGDAPSLPPVETMLIDFNDFLGTSKSAVLQSDSKGLDDLNWSTAVLVVVPWNLTIATTLAIPIASFKVAVDQDPVSISDKKWQWSYNVGSAGVTYKARLTGEILASQVKWEMYISREGSDAFPEFKWFEGTSKLDGTGGQWVLTESNLVQDPILQIDWTKSGASIGTIKYTYLKNNASNGSYIEYGLTSNAFDAYFTIHYFNNSLARFSDVNIEWNTSTKAGRIKSSDYMDGAWQCWDSGKLDIVCL